MMTPTELSTDPIANFKIPFRKSYGDLSHHCDDRTSALKPPNVVRRDKYHCERYRDYSRHRHKLLTIFIHFSVLS